MIQMNIITPFRIVSRIVPNVDVMERISAELNIERDVQNQFDDLGGSIMCSYDVSKIEPSKKKQWLDDLVKIIIRLFTYQNLGTAKFLPWTNKCSEIYSKKNYKN